MSRSKKARSPARPPAWLARLVAFCWGPGRTATLIVLVLVAFAVAATLFCRHLLPQLLKSRQYELTLDQVYVTPAPDWIHCDVRAEAFRNAGLDPPLSVLQEGLARRVFDAFAMHPWVARVVTVSMVSRHPPAKVDVALEYRRPACVVEVPGDLLPVDAEGVLLPSGDFSPIERQSYACLTGIDTRPMRFGPAWQQLKLARIQPSAASLAAREPTYELFSRAGTRIIWGLAPGTKVLGELAPAEKIARLQQYAAEHGGLDTPARPATLDIRALPPAKSR